MTNTTRNLTDELLFIPQNAVTGGVDADWRFWSGRYSLTGFWAASHVAGDRTAIDRLQRKQRP
jgi:hypothetical protein